MRKQVSEADGILIGVTESHGNVSPVLVNGFNWLA